MVVYMTSSPTGTYRSSDPVGYKGFNPANSMVENIRRDWKKSSRCLLIAADPDAHMMNNEMRFYFEKILRETELSITGLELCDGRNGKEKVSELEQYDMLILGGGHVPTQNLFFQRIGLLEKIREFDGLVMGISAGSMNCAETVYVQPELPGESISSTFQRHIPGLGLSRCNVLPHYQAVKDDLLDGKRLIEDITYADSFGQRFYAIPDGSYILQREQGAWLCGEGYLIADGEICRINENDQVLELV